MKINISPHKEYLNKLEKQLSSSDFFKKKQSEKIKLLKEEKRVREIVEEGERLVEIKENLKIAEEFELEEDVQLYKQKYYDTYQGLLIKLLPEEKESKQDILLEIKGGEGGSESELFAEDLFKMYIKYIEKRGWDYSIQDIQEGAVGGYKYIGCTIKCNNSSLENSPWFRLKQEFGVHRVQRVPITESQGRIHTSAAAVYITPLINDNDEDLELKQSELRIDTYRASGPGGQSVNTTDSAVRITHIATGISASSQNERSQLQNKESAMKLLKSKLVQNSKEETAKQKLEFRNSSVTNVDRSKKIRSYNYPENRIADHRSSIKLYKLSEVLNGELDLIIEPYIRWSLDKHLELNSDSYVAEKEEK